MQLLGDDLRFRPWKADVFSRYARVDLASQSLAVRVKFRAKLVHVSSSRWRKIYKIMKGSTQRLEREIFDVK